MIVSDLEMREWGMRVLKHLCASSRLVIPVSNNVLGGGGPNIKGKATSKFEMRALSKARKYIEGCIGCNVYHQFK